MVSLSKGLLIFARKYKNKAWTKNSSKVPKKQVDELEKGLSQNFVSSFETEDDMSQEEKSFFNDNKIVIALTHFNYFVG